MKRIVISLAERRLYLFEEDKIIRSYPVTIGQPLLPTPTGTFSIRHKLLSPGGPFGTRWMSFLPHYGIHGTNRPSLIGQPASNGCVRMFNKDIEELYRFVRVGTLIDIIEDSI